MRPTITGLVLTFNSERLLDKCLSSLSFCDKLLVIDSGSTDATLAIAARHGAEVRAREWTGYHDQHAYALGLVDTEWVFSLDSDEICTARLAAQIRAGIASSGGCAGFYVQRCSWYMDRFMRHSGWWPDRLLRVFRTGALSLEQRGIHQVYTPNGPTADLAAEIVHYPYTSFEHQLAKLNEYAEGGAAYLRKKGCRGGIGPALVHGWFAFFSSYMLKAGFLDGRAGFMAAAHRAIYVFLKYSRVPEVSWGAPYEHTDCGEDGRS